MDLRRNASPPRGGLSFSLSPKDFALLDKYAAIKARGLERVCDVRQETTSMVAGEYREGNLYWETAGPSVSMAARHNEVSSASSTTNGANA